MIPGANYGAVRAALSATKALIVWMDQDWDRSWDAGVESRAADFEAFA